MSISESISFQSLLAGGGAGAHTGWRGRGGGWGGGGNRGGRWAPKKGEVRR